VGCEGRPPAKGSRVGRVHEVGPVGGHQRDVNARQDKEGKLPGLSCVTQQIQNGEVGGGLAGFGGYISLEICAGSYDIPAGFCGIFQNPLFRFRIEINADPDPGSKTNAERLEIGVIC
jgi:hypothetical protein